MNAVNRRELLLRRLEQLDGGGPKRALGQNFLISDTVVSRILGAVKAKPFTDLVEVGPGLGALTDDLLALQPSEGARQFTLIELDHRFAEFWRGREVNEKNLGLQIIETDALRLNWQDLKLAPNSLLVSNLPYQISSSMVIDRSLQPAGIERMILMFQKEVAQRIRAAAGSKDYGLLSVIAQVFWSVTVVAEAGPRDFFPPPNVASRVLEFCRRTNFRWQGRHSEDGFLGFVKAAFAHRRKLLTRNLMAATLSGRAPLSGQEVEAWLLAAGFTITARAEELDPEAFVRLYLAL